MLVALLNFFFKLLEDITGVSRKKKLQYHLTIVVYSLKFAYKKTTALGLRGPRIPFYINITLESCGCHFLKLAYISLVENFFSQSFDMDILGLSWPKLYLFFFYSSTSIEQGARRDGIGIVKKRKTGQNFHW